MHDAYCTLHWHVGFIRLSWAGNNLALQRITLTKQNRIVFFLQCYKTTICSTFLYKTLQTKLLFLGFFILLLFRRNESEISECVCTYYLNVDTIFDSEMRTFSSNWYRNNNVIVRFNNSQVLISGSFESVVRMSFWYWWLVILIALFLLRPLTVRLFRI